eukprot:scaffold12481_cov30-Prasinocladus_malaysianus.AAC.1
MLPFPRLRCKKPKWHAHFISGTEQVNQITPSEAVCQAERWLPGGLVREASGAPYPCAEGGGEAQTQAAKVGDGHKWHTESQPPVIFSAHAGSQCTQSSGRRSKSSRFVHHYYVAIKCDGENIVN